MVVPVIPAVKGWFDGPPKNHESYDHDLFTGWRDYAVAQGGDQMLLRWGYAVHSADATPCSGWNVDDVEIWEVYNTTGDAHPFHVHLVSFQILDRQRFR
mgnify:CR=1 FL=1